MRSLDHGPLFSLFGCASWHFLSCLKTLQDGTQCLLAAACLHALTEEASGSSLHVASEEQMGSLLASIARHFVWRLYVTQRGAAPERRTGDVAMRRLNA